MVMATGIMAMDMAEIIMDIYKADMKIKTYVINLKDSVDRRDAVLAETARYLFMDVELIEAVDGRKLKPEEVEGCFDLQKFSSRYYRMPKEGEIGCTLSHRICYRKLLESEEQFALILEDDVNFIYPKDLETILYDILVGYKDNRPHFITLAMHFLYYPKKYRKLGKYTLYRLNDAHGTCAYLINRQAAEYLLSVSLPFMVADDFPFIRKRGIQIEGIYPTLAVGASTKEIIPTEIQKESKTHSKISVFQYIEIYTRIICCKILIGLGRLSFRSYTFGINK